MSESVKRQRRILPDADDVRCVCGHLSGEHNDISGFCCYRVIVGIDGDDDDAMPVFRTCDLCPTFTERVGEEWPVALGSGFDFRYAVAYGPAARLEGRAGYYATKEQVDE